MNPIRCLSSVLCILLCGHVLAQTQDMDKELSNLAEKLAAPIKENAKKKVAVIDFTDLQGTTSGELGRYIAEQLTVNLVLAKRDFSVLDRANLKSILAEHKLTSQGLIDPENAKQLGKFAGVDIIILGTIIPKGTKSISLTAKIITTDTAEIIGAARAEFVADSVVQDLVSKPAASVKTDSVSGLVENEKPKVVKSFGDLRVELLSLQIVNGSQYMLTMTLSNQNTKKSIWVGLIDKGGGDVSGRLTDSTGLECVIFGRDLSGIQAGKQYTTYNGGAYRGYTGEIPPEHRFENPLELKTNTSSIVTIKFHPTRGHQLEPGPCTLQMELLLGHDFIPGRGTVNVQNLIAKIESI